MENPAIGEFGSLAIRGRCCQIAESPGCLIAMV